MAQRVGVRCTFLLILPVIFLLVLGCSILGGCGEEVTVINPTSTQSGAVGDQLAVSREAIADMTLSDFQALVRDAADRLITSLGGDEPAFYATLLALDQGYDVYQLLTGALNDRIDAEGHITGADGSVLAPAREAEGIIEPPPGDAASGAGGNNAYSAARPMLVASLSSSPVLVAASGADPADYTAKLAEPCSLGEIYQDQVRKVTWAEDIEEQTPEEQAELSSFFYLVTSLAARGYGVQQIVEGLLLDQVEIDHAKGSGTYCLYIEHTSGAILRPVHSPLDILGELECPGASEDAPTSFSPDDVEVAVARLDRDEVDQDEDGTPIGVYTGCIAATSLADGGIVGWQVEGIVERNEVTVVVAEDGSVSGSLFYTKNGNIWLSFESHGVTCTESQDHAYVGEPTGTLTGSTGQVVFDIEGTIVNYTSEGCSTGPNEKVTSVSFKQLVYLEVRNGAMYGESFPSIEYGHKAEVAFLLDGSG